MTHDPSLKNADTQKINTGCTFRCLVLRRWFDVIAYALLSVAILLVVTQVLNPVWKNFLSGFDLTSNRGALSYASVILIAIAMLLGMTLKLGLFKPKHLSTWPTHPPVLVSVGLVISFWIAKNYTPVFALLIAIAFILVFIACEKIKGWPNLLQEASCSELVEDDLKGLVIDVAKWNLDDFQDWLEHEKPSGKLLFGYEKYVKEIYQNLIFQSEPSKRSASSLALLGDLGSGKSSIITTLEAILQKKAPDWVVVRVDAWERDANNVDEQVLALMIDALGAYVDVTGYRSLPQQYHNALDKKGGWFAVVNQLVAGRADTKQQLNRLADLLVMINKRLLVAIEDPDRGESTLRDKRMSLVWSLIDRIKASSSERIKVVVCCSRSSLNGDYRAIEYKTVVETPSEGFASIANTMVNLWCPKVDEPILPNGRPTFTDDMFPVGTPRDFKHALRDIKLLWSDGAKKGPLYGEIDLINLVQLSLIREQEFTSPNSVVPRYMKQELETRLGREALKHYSWDTYIKASLYGVRQEKASDKKTESQTEQRLAAAEARLAKLESGDVHGDLVAQMSEAEIRFCDKILKALTGLNSGKLQSVRNGNRINYHQRFLERNALHRHGLDVKFKDLGALEVLPDQAYLAAMKSLVETTHTMERANNDDIEKLLYAGGLSRYFYDQLSNRLEAEGKASKAKKASEVWEFHANQILSRLKEEFPYAPNEEGNPVGRHLFETLIKLKQLEQTASVRKLLEEALALDSSVGLEVLAYERYTQEPRLDLPSAEDDGGWLLYRAALLNKTFNVKNLGGKDFSWRFMHFITLGINIDLTSDPPEEPRKSVLIRCAEQYQATTVNNDEQDRNRTAVENLEKLLVDLKAMPVTMSSVRNDYVSQDEAKRASRDIDIGELILILKEALNLSFKSK